MHDTDHDVDTKYGKYLFRIPLFILISMNIISCTPTNEPSSSNKNAQIKAGMTQIFGPTHSKKNGITYHDAQEFQKVDTKNPCDSVIGSLFPITISSNGIDEGLHAIDKILGRNLLKSEQFYKTVPYKTEDITEQKTDKEDCWAAVTATYRNIIGLTYTTTNDVTNFLNNSCKSNNSDSAASLFNIIYVNISMAKKFDNKNISYNICRDPACIVDEIEHKNPLILLKDDHAVLVVGVKFTRSSHRNGGFGVVTIDELIYIDPIDPYYNGKVKENIWKIYGIEMVDAIVNFL